ncbi:hypothetical protein [Nocardioides litoris]|uniref:hypothetical protein n=1 Tax=Nocardioides litoris TaxID=1926648 RepID=UPI0014773020|nr:hypothetical protein [Nocardioides litoris]
MTLQHGMTRFPDLPSAPTGPPRPLPAVRGHRCSIGLCTGSDLVPLQGLRHGV